jgi:hypothetical protein
MAKEYAFYTGYDDLLHMEYVTIVFAIPITL